MSLPLHPVFPRRILVQVPKHFRRGTIYTYFIYLQLKGMLRIQNAVLFCMNRMHVTERDIVTVC